MRKSRIVNKDATCNCGCGGGDPWHKRSYRRVVTQTSDTTGTVRMPYSTQPVPVMRDSFEVDGKILYGGWAVVRDLIVWDK